MRTRYTHKQLDTTIEDVGFFDNIGNENFFIANPGEGVVATPFATGIPGTPKAERKYDVLEINVEKICTKLFCGRIVQLQPFVRKLFGIGEF